MLTRMICFLSVVIFVGCTKQEVQKYSSPNTITFYKDQYASDSLMFSFATDASLDVDVDTLYLKMRVAGTVADHDRAVQLLTAEGTTARAGVDFKLPGTVLPAGQTDLLYPLILYRTPEMKHTTFRLALVPKASDDFGANGPTGLEIGGTVSLDTLIVNVNDQVTEPTYWADISSVFGTYSAVKYQFMIQTMGYSDFSSLSTPAYYNAVIKLRNALAAYEAENGELMDESGDPVSF